MLWEDVIYCIYIHLSPLLASPD